MPSGSEPLRHRGRGGRRQRRAAHHGLRRARAAAGHQLPGPARERLRRHGRQRLREEHAAAAPGGPADAGRGRRLLRGGELLRRPAGAPGRHPRQLRGHVPAGCALELDDARRERGAAAARAGAPAAARRRRARGTQARAGRARRLRRLLPGRDQRRDAQAGGDRARHGARSRHRLPRRAQRRARPPDLAPPRRPAARAAGEPRHHLRRGHARARQHLRHRRRLGVPRPRHARHHRPRRPQAPRARGGRPDRPGVPHPRRGGPLSRRASPRLIGAFVLGELPLLVAGTVALGSRSLWGKGDRFVIYFDEPIKGLAIGAPVTFRGVNVGRVVAISAYFRTDGTAIDVPVVVELRRDAVLLETGAQPTPEVMELLVAKGARARLQLESLVTARQYVGIDFFPNTEPRRVAGPVNLPQIPSVRSPIAGVLASADDLAIAAPDLVREAGEVLRLLHGFLAGQPGADAAALLADTARLAHALGDPEGPLPRALATLPDLTAKLAGAAANLDRLSGDLRA